MSCVCLFYVFVKPKLESTKPVNVVQQERKTLCLKDKATDAVVRNLSLAKERFESSYEHTLRLTLFLDAFVLASQQMLRMRKASGKDTVAPACRNFLNLLDEERLLTMAMLGDASACILRLTRYLDSERSDITGIADQCLECANSLHHLFVDRACDDNGLTHHMLARLRSHLMWLNQDGSLQSVGGDAAKIQAALARCRPRFVAYTKLALATLMAEFPSFGCLMSFRCFQLGTSGCNSRSRTRRLPAGCMKRQESAERLALVCGLPADELVKELEDPCSCVEGNGGRGGGGPRRRRRVFNSPLSDSGTSARPGLS